MKSLPKDPEPVKRLFDVQVTEENFCQIFERVSQVVGLLRMERSLSGWCCELAVVALVRGKQCHIQGHSFSKNNACDALADAMERFIKQYRSECRFEPEEYPELKRVI